MTINNNNIFGAFTLGEVRSGRLTGDWLNKESVANYGWFGGGFPTVSTVDRIDFSNDTGTAQSRGSLSLARSRLAATGNSNYGWFGGGNPGPVSTVDRIDFSNDSSTASVRGPLSLVRQDLAATGNSNYGWFGGGSSASVGAIIFSTVDRIDFSNDSPIVSVRGPLSSIRYRLSATGNSNYGWFGGGVPGPVSTVDRIDFSNDAATASPRGPLSLARNLLVATGNSNYGWFGGGFPGPVSTVDRIDFSNDSSTASIRGPLTLAKILLAATGNSNYGWFGGGSPGPFSTVDRIDFSNDSVSASVRGPLSLERQNLAATSGVLNIRRQKSGNYGWFGGGGPFLAPTPVSTVDRIDFSNDAATTSVRGPLSLGRSEIAATGNSNYGWFGGGGSGAAFSTVDRIDFSNDSATASVRGPLSLARRDLAATGNSNYGWFGGGSNPATPAYYSLVDRIDFANDSSTASPRGPLSLGRDGLAATSGQARSSSVRLQKTGTYGWFGGGSTPTFSVVVDRIDFSNDSATASPRGSLNAGRGYLAATGNSNYGWFGGGRAGSPVATVSTVERIDFSNDSTTASVRGPLTIERAVTAAVSNPNYGWFAGGLFPGASPSSISRIDRINFSNDTRIDIRNSSLISGVGGAAVGNFNYGWFGAYGVSRLDFSNDVNSLSTRGSLSQGRDFLAATGNYDYGWFGGGIIISARSTRIDRINFSNDSVAASVRSSFIAATDKLAASGNSNYGWFGGGRITVVPTPSIVSTVNRLEFSNDLVQASPRGSLTEARLQLAATSNAPIG
jgi:hypothetical protein